MMRIVLVVAAAENGVIGKDNALLWRLPDDLKFFKSVTLGKPVVMGRKTHEAIGKPLPGRRNIVISRQSGLSLPGCDVVPSLKAALELSADAPEVAVIGGGEIYRLALPVAHRIYLTRVHATLPGDTFFDFSEQEWREVSRESHAADERHVYPFTIITLDRI